MPAVEATFMFGNDLTFRGHHQPICVDTQTDRTIGKGRWHAVPVALVMNQAGRRDAFGMLDEAIEGCGGIHQQGAFFRPDFSNASILLYRMVQFGPQINAALCQPGIEIGQGIERRRALPDPVSGVLNVLLDLAFLPAGGRIAELGIKYVMILKTAVTPSRSNDFEAIEVSEGVEFRR